MRIKNLWYWCNVCQVRFPVPVAEHDKLAGAWPTHAKCGTNSVSEDDVRFIWLDKRINKRLQEAC